MKPLVDTQGTLIYETQDDNVLVAGHYGPYGMNCMYTGQFDAGECWLCAVRRKITRREAAKNETDNS